MCVHGNCSGVAVADPRNGRRQPVGHVAQSAAGRREREPGRAEPRVLHGHGVHHAAHVRVGEPDRAVNGVHEPAAVVVAGHYDVNGRRDHAAAAAVDHRRVGWYGGDDRGFRDPSLGQGRQRLRRQFQRQRVQHGRPEDAGLQQAQAWRGVRVEALSFTGEGLKGRGRMYGARCNCCAKTIDFFVMYYQVILITVASRECLMMTTSMIMMIIKIIITIRKRIVCK